MIAIPESVVKRVPYIGPVVSSVGLALDGKAVWSDIELSGTFNLSEQAILTPSRTPAFARYVSLGINSSALTMFKGSIMKIN